MIVYIYACMYVCMYACINVKTKPFAAAVYVY